MNKFTTYVLQLPEDPDKRKALIEGIRKLVSVNGGEIASSSVYDEITYADKLSEELETHIGDSGVESFRQAFEKSERVGRA